MAEHPRALAVVLTLLLCLPLPVAAHQLRLAHFTMTELDSGLLQLSATLSRAEDPTLPVAWPAGCTAQSLQREAAGRGITLLFEVACAHGTAEPRRVATPWGIDGAILHLEARDGTRSSSILAGGPLGSRFDLPDWQDAAAHDAGFLTTAWRYLALGTEHVLIGWDHLAFVFCLSLLASGMSLLWLISAFTVGHSVSLALAHFGLINLPIDPVEAVIALSVVFMAREVLLAHSGRAATAADLQPRHRPFLWQANVTAAFGLIHGLGFASVLGDLGVDRADTVTALLFFNVGVEVGQVLFVAAVLLAFYLLTRLGIAPAMRRLSIFAVGGMGLFWTVQRVVSF